MIEFLNYLTFDMHLIHEFMRENNAINITNDAFFSRDKVHPQGKAGNLHNS
jgi:hypothetical protein